jgi:hypothetical protein
MVITISGFLKLSQLIKIWPRVSFIVKMMTTVFQKLALFFVYYLMVVGAFAVMINIVSTSIG